jgi:small subunit ribosomal protein S3
MGQKVNPNGFRLGVIREWRSRWYTPRNYDKLLYEDFKLRNYIKKKFFHASIDRIMIERAAKRVKVTIYTARPGIIIGRKGAEIEALRTQLEKETGKIVIVNIEEIKPPDVYAQLVAENVAQQLLRRIGFRRAIKKAMESTMKAGALGIRIAMAGRLGGHEMARTEWAREGRVPLHVLVADIDYGFAEARTNYGVIGIKCWIYRGDIFKKKVEKELPLV